MSRLLDNRQTHAEANWVRDRQMAKLVHFLLDGQIGDLKNWQTDGLTDWYSDGTDELDNFDTQTDFLIK